ncbi:MAG: YfhO family protein [Chloroflexota bacterium]|nr:YfhO family protein [Chloroflexota bacterium]
MAVAEPELDAPLRARVARRRISLDWAMSGLMLLLAFVFMAPGLPPLRVAAPMDYLLPLHPWQRYYPEITSPFTGGDLLYQQLPWHHWAQDEFAAGRFPVWASGPAGGMPLHASMQPAVLYPLHLLWTLMPTGAALGIIMALKLWLAGLGMWLFLRALKLHPVACALSGMSYMFSASIVNWLGWQQSGVLLLTPWLACAVYLWWQRDSRPALVGIAIVVGLLILGGHPETLFIIGLVMVGWTLGLMLTSAGTWRSRLIRMAGTVLAVALGFMLGMIQLLPFFEVLSLSHQFVLRAADDPIFRASLRLRPEEFLITWFAPRNVGYVPEWVHSLSFGFTEGVGYVGIVPIIGLGLTVLAAFRRSVRLSLVLPWLFIGIFSLVVTYDGIVGSLIRMLPGFAQSVNVRWVWIVGFAAIVLSAFGWDWLARTVASEDAGGVGLWRRLATTQAVVLIILGGAVLAAHVSRIIPSPVMEPLGLWWRLNDSYRWYWAVWSVGLFVAMLGLVFLWVTWRGGARVVPVLLGVALLVDLWSVLVPINRTAPAEQYYPVTDFIRQLRTSIPPVERVLIEDHVLPANTGLVYNIRDWRAGDPMITQRYYRTMEVLAPKTLENSNDEYNVYLRDPRYELAPLLGMRYFVTPWDEDPNDYDRPNTPKFTRLARTDGLALWQAEGVPGFTYLSDNVTAAADEEQALIWLREATWDTARSYSAVAETTADKLGGIRHQPGVSPGNVEVLEYTSGNIRLRVNADRPSLLVVSESWYPGWRAALDGQPVEILRTNYLSQGVVVPEGSHTIEMRYQSDALNLGAVLSLLGLLGTVGLAVWAWRSSRLQTTSSASE